MSSPLPYGPNAKPSSTFPDPLEINVKNSFMDGLVMASGIFLSTFVVGKIDKNLAPKFESKSLVSLATVCILSDLGTDYLKKISIFLDHINI